MCAARPRRYGIQANQRPPGSVNLNGPLQTQGQQRRQQQRRRRPPKKQAAATKSNAKSRRNAGATKGNATAKSTAPSYSWPVQNQNRRLVWTALGRAWDPPLLRL